MIDVIIPFYNNSFAQAECALQTLLQQSISPSINIYIVDDASTEKVVFEQLKQKYSALNIHFLSHKINKGPGAARNTGFLAGRAPYVFYLDCDDYIPEKDSLEVLLNTINETEADVVLGEVYNLNEIGKINIGNDELKQGYVDSPSGVSHQGNLYRRAFLEKYDILFSNSYFCEENNFTSQIKFNNPIFYHVKKKVYTRTLNVNSITYLPLEFDKYHIFLTMNTTIHTIIDGLNYGKTLEEKQRIYSDSVREINISGNIIRNSNYDKFPIIFILYYYARLIYNIGKKYDLFILSDWIDSGGMTAKFYGLFLNNIEEIEYLGKMYSYQDIKNYIKEVDKELKNIKPGYDMSVNCPWNELEIFGDFID